MVGGRNGKSQDSLHGEILEKALIFQLQHQGDQGRNGSHLLILHFDQLLCLSVWCWERQDRNWAFYPVVLSQLARETERREKCSQLWFRLAGFGVPTQWLSLLTADLPAMQQHTPSQVQGLWGNLAQRCGMHSDAQ